MPEVFKSLGQAILRTEGKSWPVGILVTMHTDEIEFDPTTGKVEFVYGQFEAVLPEKHAVPNIDEHPYRLDTRANGHPFQKGVNEFLASHGFTGTVGWSEQGRQDGNICDFDADYSIFEQVFPEEFAVARSAFEASRPEAIADGVVEYSVTATRYAIRVKTRDGAIVTETESGNNVTPPLKLNGSHSMTSIAKEQATRLAGLYRVPKIKRVAAR